MIVNVNSVLSTRSWLRLYFSIEYIFAVLLNFSDGHFEIGCYDCVELSSIFTEVVQIKFCGHWCRFVMNH